MEEKYGTCLSRGVTVLANWVYSLVPYGVVLTTLFCWVVLGWRDVPFWRVWYPVFLLSVVGRYGVYLVQFIYGWLAKLSKVTVLLDVLATVVTLLWFVTEDASVSLFWRCYIISAWIGGGVLAICLYQRIDWDLRAWWSTGNSEVPRQSFPQYVRSLNAEMGSTIGKDNTQLDISSNAKR